MKEFVSLVAYIFNLTDEDVEMLGKMWKKYKDRPNNCIQFFPILVKDELKIDPDSFFDIVSYYMFTLSGNMLKQAVGKQLENAVVRYYTDIKEI